MLAPYIFIICLDYVPRTSIDLIRENSFSLRKNARRKQCPAETITDADYADDLALLANTPAQAEFLPYSLDQAAVDIGLYVNANKTKRKRAISPLSGSPLKLDKFMYLGSSVSSTKGDDNVCLSKTGCYQKFIDHMEV